MLQRPFRDPAFRLSLLVALIVASGLGAIACGAGKRSGSRGNRTREKVILADRLIQAENYEEASRTLAEALRSAPDDPEIHYYLGICHFYRGEYPEAERSLKEALGLNKRNPDAHNALGLVYSRTGERTRALEEYRLALSDPLYQSAEKTYLNMAICLDEMGRTDEAITSLRQAVERDPKYYAAHWELAKLLDRQDHTREAIEEYEVAAPQFAADPNYHYRLGLAYFREHRTDRAREHLTKVIATLPGTEKALRAKEYLELIDDAPPDSPPGTGGGSRRP